MNVSVFPCPSVDTGGRPGGVWLEAGARRRLQAAPEGDAPLRLSGLGLLFAQPGLF